MSLDSKVKVAIVDISLMHILRTKKADTLRTKIKNPNTPKKNRQSDKRTAKKILDLYNSMYPDRKPLTEKDDAFSQLLALVEEDNYLSIRQWLIEYIPPSRC